MIHGLISLLYNGLLRGAGAAVLHASQPARDEERGKKKPQTYPGMKGARCKHRNGKKREKNNTESNLMVQNIDTAPPTPGKETTQLSNA